MASKTVLLYLLGLKLEIEGENHLKSEEPFIIVANHQSALDILVIISCLKFSPNILFVMKNELKWAGPFGIACWLRDYIFIDRKYNINNRIKLDKAVRKIRKTNGKLWFYPEGTRRNTGEIHGFKKGAFDLAIRAKLPIVAVTCSHFNFLNVENRRFDSGINI